MDAKTGFSLQVDLIGQMLVEECYADCYVMPAVVGCTKRQVERSGGHDFFCVDETLDGNWSDDEIDEADQIWIDGASYQCGSGFY